METTAPSRRALRPTFVNAVFVLLVIGVGGLIGTQSLPDAWYEGLGKPFFTPPNWVFGPVWLLLYVLIGVAGGRTFLRGPVSLAMGIWVVQMLLNWVWSPVWFTLHQLWWAFVIVSAMWLSIAAFVAATWRSDRPAALMFLPYLAWVSFAGLLNLSVALMN